MWGELGAGEKGVRGAGPSLCGCAVPCEPFARCWSTAPVHFARRRLQNIPSRERSVHRRTGSLVRSPRAPGRSSKMPARAARGDALGLGARAGASRAAGRAGFPKAWPFPVSLPCEAAKVASEQVTSHIDGDQGAKGLAARGGRAAGCVPENNGQSGQRELLPRAGVPTSDRGFAEARFVGNVGSQMLTVCGSIGFDMFVRLGGHHRASGHSRPLPKWPRSPINLSSRRPPPDPQTALLPSLSVRSPFHGGEGTPQSASLVCL